MLGLLCGAQFASAEPLSRRLEVDFFRDVPSRNLKGLAARSDGRLVAGPTLTDLSGNAPADLLWSLAPTADPARWMLGTGPDGKIFEVTIDAAKNAFTAREIAKLDEPHVFALARLADGTLLAGTSPRGALCLVRDGRIAARTALPVDSILDLLVIDDTHVLAATGNPARIYAIDLRKFAGSPVTAEKIADAKQLAERGITLFGELRDRNVRRIARMSDGDIAAGSSPKGNVYVFPAGGGAPVILQENRDAETTDLLPTPDGGLYAVLTSSGGSGEARVNAPKGKDTAEILSAAPGPAAERFGGRSTLVWFPSNGFPEILASRNNTAFYRIARHGDTILLAGGEQGEMLGYDTKERLSLTFAGSASSQLNGLVLVPGGTDRYLVLRNNAPGLALLDFGRREGREAETRRLDLGAPATIGALRFNRLRAVSDAQVSVDLRTSNGSDEVEGWGPWVSLHAHDGGWSAPHLRGRYVKLRIKLNGGEPATELDKAALFHLPQNRRPQLQEFRRISPNYAIVPATEPPAPAVTSVGQLLQSKDEDAKRKNGFLSSQIVPQPGAQVVLWTVSDPDGDNLACTFSLRRDGDVNWMDVAVNTRDSFAQFDTGHLPDGVYFTRLVATETDPRPAADRLSATFETDDLVVDHTPPEILAAEVERTSDRLTLRVHGRDALSLLDGIEAVFNNGVHEQTEQPVDGIRDSRDETFVLELPLARVAGANAVELQLYDAVGNSATRRLSW
jgi:hypothetical protein